MAEPERKCSTCKFYEPAPIWRKGWCRNPLLYAPQQSHLVAEDDLDCSRGLSDYWEAADGTGPNAGVNVAASGGSDLFGRGAAGAGGYGGAGDAATRAGGGYGADGYGGYGSAGGYGTGGQAAAPFDDDDGYAPQESVESRPAASQPRYLGAVGDEDGAGDVRNPWNNTQSGFAAPPPVNGEGDARYGGGGAGGYGAAGYGDAGNGTATDGYGDERGYGAEGYGQPGAGYGGDNRGGYAEGGYGQPGAYGQPVRQGGAYAPDPGYAQGGGNGYDVGYGAVGAAGAAAPGPTPATNGSRSQTAGSTQGGRRATPTPQGRERALTYYTEERYWTDYAKLAVPVVIVIALLGGIWFIGAGRLRGNGSATTTPGGTPLAAIATGPAGSSTRPAGSSGAGSASAAMPPRSSLSPIGTPGAGTPNPAGAGMNASGRTPTLATSVTVMRRKVSSQGGANMRSEPKVGGTPVALVPDGTEVEETGDPPQTDDKGANWYKVKFGDKTGWIRSDLFAM